MSILVTLFLFSAFWACRGLAQSAPAEPPVTDAPESMTLWTIMQQGGYVGYVIMLGSLAAVALIVQNFLIIRRDRIVPDELAQEIAEHLENKRYAEARQLCAEGDSFLAAVVGTGLSQVGAAFGFYDMQSAMQETGEREISKLYRKLEYLSFIATVSPILGLLGTVTGMMDSFNTLALTEGTARPGQLAHGIQEALVTTFQGLVVAIPTMFFVAFFRRRIDGLVAEAEAVVERLMGRFRRLT